MNDNHSKQSLCGILYPLYIIYQIRILDHCFWRFNSFFKRFNLMYAILNFYAANIRHKQKSSCFTLDSLIVDECHANSYRICLILLSKSFRLNYDACHFISVYNTWELHNLQKSSKPFTRY